MVNDELKILEQNFYSKADIFSDTSNVSEKLNDSQSRSKKRKSSQSNPYHMELLGNEVLNLLKTVNLIIKKNFDKQVGSNLKVYDSIFEWLMFVIGFRREEHGPGFLKVDESQKHVKNIQYVNMLENLKLNIVKPETKLRKKTMEYKVSDSESKDVTNKALKYMNLLKIYNCQIKNFSRPNVKKRKHEKKADKKQEDVDHSQDWMYLAILIDRLIFIVFSVIIPVCLTLMYIKILTLEPSDFE